MSDYPDQETLDQIKTFNGPLKQLLEIVQGEWAYPDYVTEEGDTWTFVTGGWSGNENLIESLSENYLAWSQLWQSSHRGGKFIFRLPKQPNANDNLPPDKDVESASDIVGRSS
jgi:hypothetical protein